MRAGASRAAVLGLAAAVAVATTGWAFRPIWDIDLFWHVAAGRWIAAHGLPETDVFSAAHPERPWSTFQWGYEWGVALLDRSWGLRGLRWLHAGVVGLALGLLAGGVAAASGSVARALGASALLLLLFEDRVRERPHVFELLFVVAMALLLLFRRSTTASAGTPSAAAAPPLLADLAALGIAPLWANIHAVSALWWPLLFGARVAGGRDRRGALLGLAGLGAIAAAPGALPGLRGAFVSHAAWPAEFVPELRGTITYFGEGCWGGVVLYGVGLGVVAALRLALDPQRPLPQRLVASAAALAALSMSRWAWFAALPVALLAASPGPSSRAATSSRPGPAGARRPPWPWLLLLAASLVALFARAGTRWTLAERMADLQDASFPVEASDWLVQAGFAGGVDTVPPWSGYLLYRLHPRATVLFDGRLLFAEDVADLLRRRFAGDGRTFDEAADRWGTRALVLPAGSISGLDPARWQMRHRDAVAELWLRSDPRVETAGSVP